MSVPDRLCAPTASDSTVVVFGCSLEIASLGGMAPAAMVYRATVSVLVKARRIDSIEAGIRCRKSIYARGSCPAALTMTM